MKEALKQKWIATLRSGNFEQGRDYLRDVHGKCCCLGVLCDIVNPKGWSDRAVWETDTFGVYEYQGNDGMPPDAFLKKVGLGMPTADKLAQMNDEGETFDVIADWIHENV